MKTTTQEQDMTTQTILDWHDVGTGHGAYAMFDHDGESYTLRIVAAGVDIYRDIEGDECRIAQTDTVAEARAFVNLYATQLI
jgi:hemin uptake protein HemP